MSATAASFATIKIYTMCFLFLSMVAVIHQQLIPVDTTFVVKTWEVVINELMVDPDPAAGSINYPEYVELYNKKKETVSLKNWKFCAGTVCKALPDIYLPADSFLVLTAPASL